jgi:hypothetical protein
MVVFASACENPSPPERSTRSPALTAALSVREAEFQQEMVKLASDAIRWKSHLQGIKAGKLCADCGAAAAIDESVAGITKSLDTCRPVNSAMSPQSLPSRSAQHWQRPL